MRSETSLAVRDFSFTKGGRKEGKKERTSSGSDASQQRPSLSPSSSNPYKLRFVHMLRDGQLIKVFGNVH